MARWICLLLVAGFTSMACALVSTSAPAPTSADLPSPEVTPTSVTIDVQAPDGWSVYRSDELGFGFAYPAPGVLASGDGGTLATINYPPDPATNVVEETILVSAHQSGGTCASPLAEGWSAGELVSKTVEVNGSTFLRQTHSGVAAGTSRTWVAYTTSRQGRCVSLGYDLRTYDPANLDPKRFPTPPATIDWQSKVQDFEAMVATFTWLR